MSNGVGEAGGCIMHCACEAFRFMCIANVAKVCDGCSDCSSKMGFANDVVAIDVMSIND